MCSYTVCYCVVLTVKCRSGDTECGTFYLLHIVHNICEIVTGGNFFRRYASICRTRQVGVEMLSKLYNTL